MTMVPVIIFGSASLIMSVFYSIFKDKGNWLGFIIRNITMLLLLVFAVVTINVTSVINGLSLFIAVAMAINMFYESLQTSKVDNLKIKEIMSSVTRGVTYLSLMLSAMSLASFSAYALVGGALVGLAIGMIVWIIKKTSEASEAVSYIFAYACLGAMIGLGINAVLFSSHVLSAILVLVAGGLLLVSEILSSFLKDGKLKDILTSEFKIVALILLVLAIFLFK